VGAALHFAGQIEEELLLWIVKLYTFNLFFFYGILHFIRNYRREGPYNWMALIFIFILQGIYEGLYALVLKSFWVS